MKIQEMHIDQTVFDTNGNPHKVQEIYQCGTFQDEYGTILFADLMTPDTSVPYVKLEENNTMTLVVEGDDTVLTAQAEYANKYDHDAIYVSIRNKQQNVSVDIAKHAIRPNSNHVLSEIYRHGLLTGCEDTDLLCFIDIKQTLKDKAELENISLEMEENPNET